MARFDIIYGKYGPYIDFHHCREWDENGGCYGTREDHGYSLDRAVLKMATYHEDQAQLYRDRTHPSLGYFLEELSKEE